MVLNEEELQRIYVLLGKAEFAQLVALSGLVQGFLEAEAKSAQDGLVLVLDKYDREAKK